MASIAKSNELNSFSPLTAHLKTDKKYNHVQKCVQRVHLLVEPLAMDDFWERDRQYLFVYLVVIPLGSNQYSQPEVTQMIPVKNSGTQCEN